MKSGAFLSTATRFLAFSLDRKHRLLIALNSRFARFPLKEMCHMQHETRLILFNRTLVYNHVISGHVAFTEFKNVLHMRSVPTLTPDQEKTVVLMAESCRACLLHSPLQVLSLSHLSFLHCMRVKCLQYRRRGKKKKTRVLRMDRKDGTGQDLRLTSGNHGLNSMSPCPISPYIC